MKGSRHQHGGGGRSEAGAKFRQDEDAGGETEGTTTGESGEVGVNTEGRRENDD